MNAAKVEVNQLFKIHPETLQIYSEKAMTMIDVPIPSSHIGPGSVSCRLLSGKRRSGMVTWHMIRLSYSLLNLIFLPQVGLASKSNHLEPSKYLIFHVHVCVLNSLSLFSQVITYYFTKGGAWSAQTSKAHVNYLREWVKKLDVPLLSIDYSLAPEAPFPRAIEEIFFAYCWVLNYPQKVGWTGENIVFVGDSAGGNLCTGCIVKCIEMGIRKPTGLFTFYSTFMVNFTFSPARFLTMIDFMVPFGMMLKVGRSYAEKIDLLTLTYKESYGEETFEFKIVQEEDEFRFNEHPFISPYLATDETLKQFPPSSFLTTSMDPCLGKSH